MAADPISAAVGPAADVARLREAYVEALLEPAPRRARDLAVAAADAGLPAESIYLQVLQPALHQVGRLWEQARITVADEHLATQVTQAVIARLAARLTPGRSGAGRRAIVCCPAGELHVLGARMVADFLEADGWDVLALGGDTPARDVAAMAERDRVELVALSAALPVHLLAAGATCAALRRLERPPFVVAGGQAFGGAPARAAAAGADAYAGDPAELLRVVARRFPADAADAG